MTGAHLLSELFRRVAATQTAHEIEQRRRLVWEQEQEAKYGERQAEMEKKMLEMSNELASLRATFNSLRDSSVTDMRIVASPVLQPQSAAAAAAIQQGSSMSPSPQPPFTRPMFIQGSSSLASIQPHQRSVSPLVSSPFAPSPTVEAMDESISQPVVQYITPDPSPHLSFVETSRTSPASSGRPVKRKHKRVSSISSSDGNSSSSSSNSVSDCRRKRSNHHDTRCYTIHVSYLGLLNAGL